MAESNPIRRREASSVPLLTILSALLPLLAAFVFYGVDPFDPAPFPLHEFPQHPPPAAPRTVGNLLAGAEFVGVGKLVGPEDIAYDAKSKVMYTGTADGWVKRVRIGDPVNDSAVEDWVRIGGRPLGIALGNKEDEVIVADAYKGLLKINGEGKIEVLADEAEGMPFKLTDGVDVTKDGVIYFTDASSKYELHEFMMDLLEGKPFGRLLSYDLNTGKTTVLLKDLYFANGVALSPNQDFIVFCESLMRRCMKYYIQGEKSGEIESFIKQFPGDGSPDNVRYGEGYFWIGIAMEKTYVWDLALRYPVIRKVMGMVEKYIGLPSVAKNSGVLQVDLEGKLVAHYLDPNLAFVSTGLKIGDHLYFGSLTYPYIIRLNLKQYSAHSSE